MDPLISIIMPVHNAKEYIGRTLHSILSQDFNQFELIIINDGSTDGSDNICKAFATKDNRITIINQKNAGTSAARNAGLDIAKGKYITFCDHDDEYLPHLLRDNFELIEKEQADVLQFSINRINSDIPTQILHQRLRDQSIDATDIRSKYIDIRLTENFMDVWNHLYLHSSIQQVRFNPVYNHGFEDLDFNIHVLAHVQKKYLFSSNIYYNHYLYTHSSGNTFSRKITDKTIKEYNTLFQLEYFFLKNFQDKNSFSTSKASQILLRNLDILESRTIYNNVSSLKEFYKNPLFFQPPFKLSWDTHFYLWAFFNNHFFLKLLKILDIAHNSSSTNAFENTALYGFFFNLFNSSKGKKLFHLCNTAVKLVTIPFRIKKN